MGTCWVSTVYKHLYLCVLLASVHILVPKVLREGNVSSQLEFVYFQFIFEYANPGNVERSST